jgi:DNA cross-link repair 1C protein
VSLFRPKKIVPNTLNPNFNNLDCACIMRMFNDHVSAPHADWNNFDTTADASAIIEEVENDLGDPHLLNLVGQGAAAAAERWAENGGMMKSLGVMRGWFEDGSHQGKTVARVLGRQNSGLDGVASGSKMLRYGDSDEETTDDDASQRGHTAEYCFGAQAGLDTSQEQTWVSSSPPSDEKKVGKVSENISPLLKAVRNRLTPESSPIRFRMDKGKRRRVDSSSPSMQPEVPPPYRQSHQQYPGPIVFRPMTDSSKKAKAHPRPATSPDLQANRTVPLNDVHNYPLQESPLDTTITMERRKRRRVDLLPLDAIENDPFADNFSGSSASQTRSQTRASVYESGGQTASPPTRTSRWPTSWSPTKVPHRDNYSVSISSLNEKHGPPISTAGQLHVQTPNDEREMMRAERLKIAEKLSRARPDLVTPSYPTKRARMMSRTVKEEAKRQYIDATSRLIEASGDVSSFQTVDDDDGGMDWERSRELADSIREQLANERKRDCRGHVGDPSERSRPFSVILPPLTCVESQPE